MSHNLDWLCSKATQNVHKSNSENIPMYGQVFPHFQYVQYVDKGERNSASHVDTKIWMFLLSKEKLDM